MAGHRAVTADYLPMLGVKLLHGRPLIDVGPAGRARWSR